jgi:hypothetical protein
MRFVFFFVSSVLASVHSTDLFNSSHATGIGAQ